MSSETQQEKEQGEELENLYDAFCNWYQDDGSYDNFLKSEALKSIKEYAKTLAQPKEDDTFQKDLANALEWLVLFQSTLGELVQLKKNKDAEGKTPDYEKRQPLAWERACQVMEWFKKDDGFVKAPEVISQEELWINVDHDLPAFDVPVLCGHQPSGNQFICYYTKDCLTGAPKWYGGAMPTHWRKMIPLPIK